VHWPERELVSFHSVPLLYLALMGPGAGRVAETERRKGKDPTARPKPGKPAGVCLHADQVDEEGYPLRDPESTTYVWSDRTAEEFGPTDLCEAVRRGLTRAVKVVVLGDGAPWIWESRRTLPGAIQIVDRIIDANT